MFCIHENISECDHWFKTITLAMVSGGHNDNACITITIINSSLKLMIVITFEKTKGSRQKLVKIDVYRIKSVAE